MQEEVQNASGKVAVIYYSSTGTNYQMALARRFARKEVMSIREMASEGK